MTPNDTIAAGYRMAKATLHRFVDDLTAEEFQHQPVAGANSAAWVVGHLALTAHRTAERLGATGLPAVPPGLGNAASKTGKPAGDQSGIGNAAELLQLFDVCIDKVVEAVGRIPAESLAAPAPSPSPFSERYADALLFGTLHIAMHTGQLTTIRRSLGKPPKV